MACSLSVTSSSDTRTGNTSSSSSIRSRSSSAGTTMLAKKGVVACLVLLSSCGHLPAPGGHAKQVVGPMLAEGSSQQLDFEPRHGRNGGGGGGGGVGGSGAAHPFYQRHRRDPRILTVLTTYSNRTAYAKANREAIEEREDGYKPVVVFITSDEDDEDMDEAVSFKYGAPQNHRLLGAVTEAYSRYKGQFDWIAIGDDDTVFMYNRARAFLRNIDHRKPVALGFVDGLIGEEGGPAREATCFSPSEKMGSSSDEYSDRGCCQDFTRPCRVPPFPDISEPLDDDVFGPAWWGDHQEELSRELPAAAGEEHFYRNWHTAYGKGGLFWPYGGAGTFLSVGLMETVQGDDGTGWEQCTEIFGVGYSTDIQLAMCLRAHGLTMSAYFEGFDRWCTTGDPDSIRERLAQNCQVLGIHLGLKHLHRANGPYTPQSFKDAASAVHDEDQRWASQSGLYMAAHCPQAWNAIAQWK